MASYLPSFQRFMPQSMQKRLLRYLLTSYAPVDLSTIELEKLDFQLGRKSVIALTDVGLDGDKLHPMLNLPEELQITSASVGNLTINIPLDLHRSPIEVFIDGVKVVATVLSPSEVIEGKNNRQKGRRKQKTGNDYSRMSTSILPTPEEVAMDFVQKEPKKAKRKLERSVMAAYGEASAFWHNDFEDDINIREESLSGFTENSDDEDDDDVPRQSYTLHQHHQGSSLLPDPQQQTQPITISRENSTEDHEDSSDDDDNIELGTGAALEVPEFVASFIKGIGDRLQLHVGEVCASVQIRQSQAFPHMGTQTYDSHTNEQMATLELRMAGVIIEGVTVASPEVDISAFAPSGSGQIKAGKKKIQLNRLNAFLTGDEAWFDEPKSDINQQGTDDLHEHYNRADSPYHHMHESTCTIKDVGASVATLKGETSTPNPATPKPALSTSPTPFPHSPTPHSPPPPPPPASIRSASSQSFTAPSSISGNDADEGEEEEEEDDDDDDDMFESLHESMTGDDHDKLSASVVSLGSFSDAGTAHTSHQESLTESQIFADPDSDNEDGPRYRNHKNEGESGNEELPFAMASYIADREIHGSLFHDRDEQKEFGASSEDQDDILPPLPLSPSDPSSSQTSLLSNPMPARPLSLYLPPSSRDDRPGSHILHKSTPALISTSLLKTAPSSDGLQNSSLDSLPPPSPPPEPVMSSTSPIYESQTSTKFRHSSNHSGTPPVLQTISSQATSPNPHNRTHSVSSGTTSESEWEEDDAAREKLSQSMFFSHEDAGSLYMSAMSGALDSSTRLSHHDSEGMFSADGMEDTGNAMRSSLRGGQRKGELQGEDLTEDELEQRLNKLVGTVSNTNSPEVTKAPLGKRLRKKIAEIDYVDIWVPALATQGVVPAAAASPPSEPVVGSPGRNIESTHHGHLPGSFSLYGASPPITKIAPPSPRPTTPKVAASGVKFSENMLHSPHQSDQSGALTVQKDAEVEVFVGKVTMKTDLIVGGLLARFFGALGMISAPSEPAEEVERVPEIKREDHGSSRKKVEVVVGEIDCRLVQTLIGQILLGNGEPEQKLGQTEDNTKVILDFNIQHTRLSLSTLVPKLTSSLAGHLISTTKLSFGNIEFRDTKGAFIQFVPHAPVLSGTLSHGHSSKGRTFSSEKGIAMQSDVKLTITTAGKKTKIEVETFPLHIKCELHRIEELLNCLGGFGNVLGLSSVGASGFNTPTPVTFKQAKGVTWQEDTGNIPQKSLHSTTPQPELKIDANIGGLIIDVMGDEGAVGLRTSIIKVRKRHSLTTVIGIDQILILGPYLVSNPQDAEARIIVDKTRMEFSSKPDDEDLARLLKLLTPSKDKFAPDDDIMLDILLEQRRQGSVLRVSIGNIHTDVDNLKASEKFQSLGEEVAKVLAVTNYIPQDERPGLLTLLYVGGVDVGIKVGGSVGKIDLHVKNLELSHVGGPNLIALAMGSVGVKRNGMEELIGEGLPKEIAIRGFMNHAASGARKVTVDEDRPMVMVRVGGDDPEPVIKIKLWNVRVEYNVDTLMALMDSPGASGDAIAREMVDSIATLTEKQVMKELGVKRKRHVNSPYVTTRVASPTTESISKPIKVEIAVRDTILGLNPLILPSRGLIILTESKISLELPSPHAELEMIVDIKRASLSLIDDVSNLLAPEKVLSEGRHRRRKEALTEHLTAIAELGYVSIASISSAKAILKLIESEVPGDKCVDLEVYDDLFIMETCADSTQTLLGIVNGLKPPLPEEEEIKYCTQVMGIEMFNSIIDEVFFKPDMKQTHEGDHSDNGFGIATTAGVLPEPQETVLDDADGDMVSDDVPNNLAYVESYYGNRDVNHNYSQEELAEDMLADGLDHIAKPSRPLRVGEKGELKTFEEQIQIHDDALIDINDDYFAVVPKESLIEMAAKSAIGAPVRIKIRDVHFIWNLHDGYDWPKTRDVISKAVKRVEGRAMQRRGSNNDPRPFFDMDDDDPEESVIGDLLFNSIYIGIPANRDPRELSRQINNNLEGADTMSETGSYASTGLESRPASRSRASTDPRMKGLKLTRSRAHKMQIELKGVCVDFVLFPQNGGETQSSIDLKVRDMEIIDNVPTSTWKKFVTYMRDAGNRETGSQMAHIEVLNVKPVPKLAASELVIKATILPLRLHVDQDTLDFLTRFFEFKDDTVVAATPPQDEPFIQRIEVNSVRVKLDYKPKRVDYVGLRSGHTTEFMNFVILEEADMVLKHVILHGISGMARLNKALNDTWMPDIQRTQLGDVLSGVAPVRSLVNIGSGVKDLVVVPMREYKKDGRIIRSVSKGMVSFASKTTKELVKLGAKVAVGTQTMLENTEEFLGGKGSASRAGEGHYHGSRSDSGDDYDGDDDEERVKVISLYADQPRNVTQGLRNAGVSFKRNLHSAREALRAVPGEVAERGSAQGMVQAVARAAPIAVLRPMIGASEAISKTLLGATNSMDKEMVKRVDDKYKKH